MTYSVAWNNKHFGVEHGFETREMADRFIEHVCRRIDQGITAYIEDWIPDQKETHHCHMADKQ